jgi:short/branched chain acyl-CoA dehydrogenase
MITSLLRPMAKTKPATRLLTARRRFSVSSEDALFADTEQPNPVTVFTDDEQMIRDAVRVWAREELQPVVREMDNEAKLRPEILQALFQQGLMGMEIPESKTLSLFS